MRARYVCPSQRLWLKQGAGDERSFRLGWRSCIFHFPLTLGPRFESRRWALCGMEFQSLPDCVGTPSWNNYLWFPPTTKTEIPSLLSLNWVIGYSKVTELTFPRVFGFTTRIKINVGSYNKTIPSSMILNETVKMIGYHYYQILNNHKCSAVFTDLSL